MGRHRKLTHVQDGHLLCIKGGYDYRRRVPTELKDIDERGEAVRIWLKTDDLAKAKAIRECLRKGTR
jgi:hypothetical protein